MNNLKKMFFSIKGQFDQMTYDFENHEALADAAIKELKQVAGKTLLHLHRINKLNSQYQTHLQELDEQAKLWSERAIKSKAQDEQKALQCVKQLQQVKKKMTLIDQQHQESVAQEKKIRADYNAIQDQIQILNNKKEMLAARQNRNNLQGMLIDNPGHALQDVQSIFDRWEGTVVMSETDFPDLKMEDQLAAEFEQEEELQALKKALDELSEVSAKDSEGGV